MSAKDSLIFRVGVRGKLVLPLLLLVVLSMWLLGLGLMQLAKSGLTAQLSARGWVIAAAVERAFRDTVPARGEAPESGDLLEVQRFLWTLLEDPELDQVDILDSGGELVISSGGDRLARGSTERGGDDPLVFSFPLYLNREKPGTLVVGFARGAIQKQLTLSHLRIIVQLAITSLVLIVFINILATVMVLSPIRKLLAATRRAGEGNLNQHVEGGGRDEIGDLADSFNIMLMQLKESREENRQQLDSLRRAHEDLLATKDRLINSERMAAVGRVASGVAHEVGNPLGAVTGYLAMTADESSNTEERRDYLARAEREINRINRIMKDLLNYARPPRQELSEIDLNLLVRDTHHLLTSQNEFGKVDFDVRLAGEAVLITGDLHWLQQMLINIALNAVQAMPEGGTITIEVLPGDGDDHRPRLRVEDSGQGIPAESIPHIFEPFFTTRTGSGGSGLGLALCHQIATAMGAEIEVESGAEKGTLFTVIFPKHEETGEKGVESV
jgi:two-component system NtrC family sensor kinase